MGSTKRSLRLKHPDAQAAWPAATALVQDWSDCSTHIHRGAPSYSLLTGYRLPVFDSRPACLGSRIEAISFMLCDASRLVNRNHTLSSCGFYAMLLQLPTRLGLDSQPSDV